MNWHRLFAPRALRLSSVAALIAIASTLTGCSHKSGDGSSTNTGGTTDLLAPSSSEAGVGLASRRSLYPLTVGNLWTYRVRTTDQITTDAGPQPPVIEEHPAVVGIEAAAFINGDDRYFSQVEAAVRGDTLSGSLFYVRSNRQGVFELDLSFAPNGLAISAPAVDPAAPALTAYVDRTIADPAQRIAFQHAADDVAAKLAAVAVLGGRPRPGPLRQGPRTGAEPGELTLLSYPVIPGARWVVRDDPRFARLVVGRDQVHVPFGTFGA
jgi:hypothetical protein